MDRPSGVVDFVPSAELFPFESRWFESEVGPVHYIDEGSGRPLLLMHGNPDWSFLYRKIILGLKDSFRCIAPDYPGFGLSVHPDEYGYTAREHARVIASLVDHLELDDFIVMGQDWGGPIGMAIAAKRADRVHGLVMGNTWYWPESAPMISVFSRTMSSFPVQQLIKRKNFFVSSLMKRSLRAELSDEEFDHYRHVVPTQGSRTGIAVFPKEIRAARPWLRIVEREVQDKLAGKPTLLTWGMKDPAFGRGPFLAKWQEDFPDATVVRLEEAGHYIQEDAPEEIVEAIKAKFGG